LVKVVGKIGRKFTLYPPREFMRKLGLKEGDTVVYTIKDGKLVVEPVENPFKYALRVKKWAKIKAKELEEFSEKMQMELIGGRE